MLFAGFWVYLDEYTAAVGYSCMNWPGVSVACVVYSCSAVSIGVSNLVFFRCGQRRVERYRDVWFSGLAVIFSL